MTTDEFLIAARGWLVRPDVTIRGLVNIIDILKSIDPDHGLDNVDPRLIAEYGKANGQVQAGELLPYGKRVNPNP